MHGIPISRVAPRGSLDGVSREVSRIVSEELLRLRDSRTVETLLDETTLSCLACEKVLEGFALIVLPAASSPASEDTGDTGFPFPFVPPFVFTDAGDFDEAVLTVDRAMDFLVAVDFVETVERIETADGVRLATGLSLAGSEDLLLTDGVVRDATEGGRFGTRGVLGPVVCTLEVEIEDAAEDFLVRPTLLGVSSDRAVSNAVVFSLAIDTVDGARDGVRDGAREPPEGVRRPEGPAAGPLRIVDVVERVERTELATDLGRGKRSGAVECTEGVPLRTLEATLFRGRGLGLGESGERARSESARLERERLEWAGVSFESGRRLLGDGGMRRGAADVETFEATECVLRAIERTEAADDLRGSRAAIDRAVLRMECRLTVSDSSLAMGPFRTVSFPPLEVEVGVAGSMRSWGSLMSSSGHGL